MSLISRNNLQHHQESEGGCEMSRAAALGLRLGWGGATTKTRIVLWDILRDRDMKTCGPYNLTNHTNQPSHQEVTSRGHGL